MLPRLPGEPGADGAEVSAHYGEPVEKRSSDEQAAELRGFIESAADKLQNKRLRRVQRPDDARENRDADDWTPCRIGVAGQGRSLTYAGAMASTDISD